MRYVPSVPDPGRTERHRLSEALAAYRCPRCGRNHPRVTSTRRPVRYVRCSCGATGKIVLRLCRPLRGLHAL